MKKENIMNLTEYLGKRIYLNRIEIPIKSITNLKLKFVFFVIVVAIISVQSGQASETISVSALTELAMSVKDANKKLHNFKVDSELWVDENDDPKDPNEEWRETLIHVNSTMWSDGKPSGKIRVDVHKQVLRWVRDGKSDSYSERSFSDSFDGVTGRSIVKRSGEFGKAKVVKDKKVTSGEKPQIFETSWFRRYTGRDFSVYFIQIGEGSLLLDLFGYAGNPNAKVLEFFDFTRESLHEIDCIKISSKESKTQNWGKRWWLDPARGFALLRFEHVRILEDKTEEFRVLTEVQELREIKEGIWWPLKATCIIEPTVQGDPYTRMKYRAFGVIANDLKFDESVYSRVD